MNDRVDAHLLDVDWPAWNRTFDRAAQLALCAGQLEMLRRTLGNKWPLLGGPKPRQAGLAEAKDLAKRLIRVASESVDFYATVDFITHAAHGRLDDMRRANDGRPLIGHLKNWEKLTHEHMVPGTVVLDAVTSLPADQPILPVLDALSYRALVSRSARESPDRHETDAYLLDGKDGWKSALPDVSATGLFARGFLALDDVPFQFWPLMRYEAAGLLEKLVPVNERARTLLAAYETARPH
jgi:hypothetical protein